MSPKKSRKLITQPCQPMVFPVSLSMIAKLPVDTTVIEVRILTQLRLRLSPKRSRKNVMRRPELVAY